jgi:heat shock protein HtpX
LIGFYYSDKIAISSVGARLADKKTYKDFYNLVEGLTIASGLPMPKLYVMNSPQINAFASGRNPENSVICVTTGALEKLERRELEGVLSHELSHVANYDIRYMTLVAVMVGMISIISEIFLRSLWIKNTDNNKNAVFVFLGILLAILAPIVVYLVELSISRKREYSADASAVKFTRYPAGLIGALKKIKSNSFDEKKINKAISPLFFSNPLKGITSTHPPIDERIKILERM